ncbi:MAG TPA: hypothetical protein VFZ73_03220 [Gemmatimonadaceae bacterium]
MATPSAPIVEFAGADSLSGEPDANIQPLREPAFFEVQGPGRSKALVNPPRVFLDFQFPAVRGRTIRVNAGQNLQSALNAARRGDEVVLAAGATFTGNFTLPAKAGTAADGWIVLRGEALSRLPAIGTRVTPAVATLMPTIMSPNQAPAIKTEGAASGWWLGGVEITVSPSFSRTNFGLIWLGEQGRPQTSLDDVPSDLVLDRMYIHGQTTSSVQRCVSLNSARTQITDSYITECHAKGFDTQAIWGGNGPGPYKIVNNYLAGAGENIMFGGADPTIPGLVPSDIEIRRNYFHTPITWKTTWTKKNLLELKNASRVLIEANVFDGSWLDAQTGWAVMFKSTNQNGGCRWCRTTDVTFRRNLIKNAGGGVNIGTENNYPVDSTARRLLVSENVLDDIATLPYTGDRRGFHVLGNVADVTLERNVLSGSNLQAAMLLDAMNGGAIRSVFRDNVWAYGSYGIIASNYGNGTLALNAGSPGYTWSNMTLVATSKPGYPTGTIFVTPESSAPLAAQIRSLVSSAISGLTP